MSLRTLLDIPDGVPRRSRAQPGTEGLTRNERQRIAHDAAHLRTSSTRHTPKPVQTGSEHRGRIG